MTGDNQSLKFHVRSRGGEMSRFLGALAAGRVVRLEVLVEYRNLEEVDLVTSVIYELSCLGRNGDVAMLNSAIEGHWGDRWVNEALVAIDAKLDRSSWKHHERR